jgi:3D (Asp-Asp-Asp) domain-containing protein
MKAFLGRSIVVFSVLLVALIVFSAKPSIADTPLQSRDPKIGPKFESDETLAPARSVADEKPLVPATSYVATAYSLRGRTASGRMVSRGLIAADPRVLPLGSRVKLEVAGYHGEYVVADTGGMIKGKRIDIWTPSSREAMRFGRRRVKLTVLSYGSRRTR